MKKFVIAPDSFKGTMTSTEVCRIIENRTKEHFPNASIVSIPIADGGEGTAECFLHATGKNGECVSVTVKNPYFEDMDGYFVLINSGRTAIVEMAVCAGLPVAGERKNPAVTTTYGVGQLIKAALDKSAREIIIALGGSCTNDGGCGCAAALGVEFLNEHGQVFIPVGGTLSQIHEIRTDNLYDKVKNTKITIMCDVDNPLYGENGAAYIYGPQKGADENMILMLDRGLRHLSEKITAFTPNNIDISVLKGAGAAGGMGGGLTVFLNGHLQSGIETMLDALGFDSLIRDADLIFTGEGRIDSQTIRGKAVAGVALRAKQHNIPVIAVVGNIGDGAEQTYDIGVTAIVNINRASLPLESAALRCKEDLAKTIDDILKIITL